MVQEYQKAEDEKQERQERYIATLEERLGIYQEWILELARRSPYEAYAHPSIRQCWWCEQDEGTDHYPDCTWLQANKLAKAIGAVQED